MTIFYSDPTNPPFYFAPAGPPAPKDARRVCAREGAQQISLISFHIPAPARGLTINEMTDPGKPVSDAPAVVRSGKYRHQPTLRINQK